MFYEHILFIVKLPYGKFAKIISHFIIKWDVQWELYLSITNKTVIASKLKLMNNFYVNVET